jgi:hypothetical protein
MTESYASIAKYCFKTYIQYDGANRPARESLVDGNIIIWPGWSCAVDDCITIDEVRVAISLEKTGREMGMSITSVSAIGLEGIYPSLFDKIMIKECDDMNLISMTTLVEDVYQIAHSLKFDVLNGKFLEPDELIEAQDDDGSCDICPICMEMTKTTLPACHHHLCHRCSSNKLFRHRCPQCRALVHCEYSSDDEFDKETVFDSDSESDSGFDSDSDE